MTVDQLWGIWNGSIVWRASAGQPAERELPAFPGWSLVLPWALSPAEMHTELLTVFKLPDGEHLVMCRELSLRYRGPELTDDDLLIPSRTALEILRRLRYLARQFDISLRSPAFGTRGENSGGGSIFDGAVDGLRTYSRDYHVPTAITAAHIDLLANLPCDFVPPIHAEIFLDALQAHADEDPRRALLFAAIAAESCAFEQLEEAYERGVAGRDRSLRLVDVPVAGGATVTKDPVYEALRDADAFKHLLHTRPLYLLHRSLMVDQPETYRLGRKLYSTRNKLVHYGKVPAEDDYFPITREGAIEGLETAREIIEWFGDSGPYCVFRGMAAFDGSRL